MNRRNERVEIWRTFGRDAYPTLVGIASVPRIMSAYENAPDWDDARVLDEMWRRDYTLPQGYWDTPEFVRIENNWYRRDEKGLWFEWDSNDGRRGWPVSFYEEGQALVLYETGNGFEVHPRYHPEQARGCGEGCDMYDGINVGTYEFYQHLSQDFHENERQWAEAHFGRDFPFDDITSRPQGQAVIIGGDGDTEAVRAALSNLRSTQGFIVPAGTSIQMSVPEHEVDRLVKLPTDQPYVDVAQRILDKVEDVLDGFVHQRTPQGIALFVPYDEGSDKDDSTALLHGDVYADLRSEVVDILVGADEAMELGIGTSPRPQLSEFDNPREERTMALLHTAVKLQSMKLADGTYGWVVTKFCDSGEVLEADFDCAGLNINAKTLDELIVPTDEPDCTCLGDDECDCQSPDTNPALVSNECPTHNMYPQPSATCPVHGEDSEDSE